MRTVIPSLSEAPATRPHHTSVCQKDAVFGKKVLENGCSLVIAGLSLGQQKQSRPPMPVADRMEFGIQSALCPL